MREMTVREANKNFSQVIAAAERGETIVIAKNGRPVAKISPQMSESLVQSRMALGVRRADPERAKQATGFRVGTITEDDKYGDGDG